MKAVVIVTHRTGQEVWVDYLGESVPCRMDRRLASRGRPVPGDEVEIERMGDGSYVVIGSRERRGGLLRLSGARRPGGGGVANVDQVVVVVDPSCLNAKSSRLKPEGGRSAAAAGARVLLAVNKCDLEDEGTVGARIAPWLEDGAEVVLTSALTGRGLGELRRRLYGRVSALVGVPGAGTTSLIEALYPGYGLKEKSSELYPLPGGGYLAV